MCPLYNIPRKYCNECAENGTTCNYKDRNVDVVQRKRENYIKKYNKNNPNRW